MAIQPYNTNAENTWNKGGYRAMIRANGSERPFGYCDGNAEDEAALIAMAEGEGLEAVRIDKKSLKTGREVWTIVGTQGEGGGGGAESGDW